MPSFTGNVQIKKFRDKKSTGGRQGVEQRKGREQLLYGTASASEGVRCSRIKWDGCAMKIVNI